MLTYCRYGPADGVPLIALPGAPGTRLERPDVVDSFERAGLRVLIFDRPGYGGSTRRPGRRVTDVVADVRLLADTEGWERFAVTGHSCGGPHALACAALLADRVTRCAVVAGLAPPDAAGLDFFGRDLPGRGDAFRHARDGDAVLRPYLAGRAQESLAHWARLPPSPGRPERLRAMYVDGLDGWVDDQIALVHPWGFDVAASTAPVRIWYGADDSRVPRTHADWLLAHIPGAVGHEYPGGHEPAETDYHELRTWLAAHS